jgi:sugar O-acyltransferase (sialic acid O-acetyltransferase NeuD family)
MQPIVVFGAGGFGREVAQLIEDINRASPQYELLGFVDDDPSMPGKALNGHPVKRVDDGLSGSPRVAVAVAVGDPVTRMRVVERIRPYGVSFPNLVHPSVVIGREVSMGVGNIICAGSILTVNIRLGDFCQLNLKTTVGHDAVLDHFATSACGVDFAGYSHMGVGTYFGNQATVLQSVRVGPFTTVGAGAVVNRELPAGVTAVGVPARVIKENPDLGKLEVEFASHLECPATTMPFEDDGA